MNQFKQLNVKYHGKLFLQCCLARPNANVFVIIAALKRFIQFSPQAAQTHVAREGEM